MVTQAYSYIRFSSKGQEGNDSLQRQIDGSGKYAAAQGWMLDETLRDLGVSGWKGKHRTTGSLARFLKLVEAGTVKRGSWLIVEAMDRLSREQISDALTLFLQLIRAGIGIATLTDNRQYTEKSINQNPHELMYSIMLMGAANEYSSKLSQRVRHAKETALADLYAGRRKVVHGKPPFWIEYTNGAYRLHPERSQAVRQMIGWAMDGVGAMGIAKRLTAAGIRTHHGKRIWNDTTVYYLLRSRSLIGEFTPEQRRDGKHTSSNPIAGYYPPVLTEEKYYRLQSVLDARKVTIRGRRGSGAMTNIWGSVLTSGHDGSSMMVIAKKNPRGQMFLNITSANAMHSDDGCRSIQYEPLVQAFMEFVNEVRYTPKHKAQDGELAIMEGQRREQVARLAKIQALIEQGDVGAIATVAKAAQKIEAELKDLDAKIERKKAEQHRPAATTKDVSDLAEQLATAKDKAEVKQKIKMAVAQVVKSMRIWIKGNTYKRAAVVEVIFNDDAANPKYFGIVTERSKAPRTPPVGQWMKGMKFDPDYWLDALLNDPATREIKAPRFPRAA